MRFLDKWKFRAVIAWKVPGFAPAARMARALCWLVVLAGEKHLERPLSLEEACYVLKDFSAWCAASEQDASAPDVLADPVRDVWRFITTEWMVRSGETKDVPR